MYFSPFPALSLIGLNIILCTSCAYALKVSLTHVPKPPGIKALRT
jgi:hypothetical protein